jgi:hypothetical protein
LKFLNSIFHKLIHFNEMLEKMYPMTYLVLGHNTVDVSLEDRTSATSSKFLNLECLITTPSNSLADELVPEILI